MAEQKSAAAEDYREMGNTFIPRIMMGSRLGLSYGYSLALAEFGSAIFNLMAESALFHSELQESS